MKRIVGFIIIFIFVISVANVLSGNPYKKMKLPDVYSNETSIATLSDSLKSSDEGARIYAAVRLGQLKDPSAIAALKEAYETEPHYSLIDHGNGVKYYCLVSIASIGGPEAVHFLEELGGKLLAPEVASAFSPHYIHFGDTLEIFSGLCEAMAAIDQAPFSNILLRLFDNPQIDPHLREISYRSYLKMELKAPDFTSLRDSIYFLLDKKREEVSAARSEIGESKVACILRNNAIRTLLIDYGVTDPSILREYESTLPAHDLFIPELDSLSSILDVLARQNRPPDPMK